MMLVRTLVVLLAISGCSESLFGTHGNPDGGSGSGSDSGDAAPVPDTCSAPCLADATANFDGTVNGANAHWRYLGDKRDHTWAPMTPVAMAMVGDANNRIERCADQPSAPACEGLPGALLVTSSGTSSMSDPALEYTASSPNGQVIQLALHVNVPQGSVEHRVRLYRNSREDVLFTASAAPGATVANTITVDALPGDRFLVALEPTGAQGGTAAVNFFMIDANKTFPSTCELALTFSDTSIVGATVDDLCGAAFTSLQGALPMAPSLVTGPFAYQGNGVYFEDPLYLAGSQPIGGGDRTIQFWVQNAAPSATRAWVFSDLDEANARGLGIRFINLSGSTTGLQLEAAVVASTNPVTYATRGINITDPQPWHFVRVVHVAGMVTLCLDGTQVTSAPLLGPTGPGRAPNLGRNANSFEDFTGQLDDVRVFSGTLPCNP